MTVENGRYYLSHAVPHYSSPSPPCPQAIAVGVPVVLGGIIGSICFEDQATWYRTLKRPFWEPPPPVFGQVCTVIQSVQLPAICL